MVEFLNTREIIENLCKITEKEEASNPANPVLDPEERWILENAPALYILEKASSVVQPANRSNFKIDNLLKKIYKRLEPGRPVLKDHSRSNPRPTFRTIYFNEDFEHNGLVGVHGQFTDPNLQNKQMRLAKELSKVLNFPETRHFILILSLSFGAEFGGHFAAVIGTVDPITNKKMIYIFDPYFNYFGQFLNLMRNVMLETQVDPAVQGQSLAEWKIASIISLTTNYVEIAIHPGFNESPRAVRVANNHNILATPGPNTTQQVKIQDSRGQDHFCWAWDVLCLHVFMGSGCDINYTQTFLSYFANRTDQQRAQVPLVAYIKAYITILLEQKIIPTTSFVNNVFNYIWHSKNMENYNVSSSMNPTDFTLYSIERGQGTLEQELQGLTISPVTIDMSQILQVKAVPSPLYCKVSDRLALINEIPAQLQTNLNLLNPNNTTNVIKICRILLSHVVSLTTNIPEYNPDDWLQNFLVPGNFLDNKANLGDLDCTLSDEDLEMQGDILSNLFTLESYEKSGRTRRTAKQKCDFNNSRIKTRNTEKDKIIDDGKNALKDPATNLPYPGPSCTQGVTPVFDYQETVVRIMVNKANEAHRAQIANTPRPPGLIVWYGTGSGKTLAATMVAKLFAICNRGNIFRNCYIISPKSAIANFASELKKERVFPDNITLGDTETSMYYRAGNIKMFSHSNFERYIENEGRNADFSQSLLIVDEAHNFFNIDGKPDMRKTRIMLNVCRRMKLVMALTATPMANSPYDLETLLAMIDGRDPIPKSDFSNFFTELNAEVDLLRICTDPLGEPQVGPSANSPRTPRRPSPQERAHFENRIIRYENPVISDKMPSFHDIRACVDDLQLPPPVQSALQTAIVSPEEIPRGSNLKGSGSGFGSAERNIIWELGDENPKLIAIKDIIEKRETTEPKELSISGNSGNPNMPYNGANLRYKYIIFSKIVDNLMIIKDYLYRKAHIPKDAFGEIHGKISGDSVDERKRRAQKFNEGTTRIMLISEAAEEGVDFKRASVVILAEPVYNWSEYVQIRGRAVRTNSAKPPDDEEKLKNIPDSHPDKLVAKNIESFIVVFNKSYPRPGQAEKLSWDMTSFKQMYTKKFELEEFSKEIQKYFFSNGAIANSASRILYF